MKTKYRFRFFRAGGVDQVELESGADLVALQYLKQELWVALSCPVEGLEFDRRTLALIDSDNDGRVRAPELLKAIAWTDTVLSDIEELSVPLQSLKLSSIDQETAEGKLILKTVQSLLKGLGKGKSATIEFDEVIEAIAQFNQRPANGDGILPAETLQDESLKAPVTKILSGIAAPAVDRSGHPGVTKEQVEAFFQAARARKDWMDAATTDGRDILGDRTLDAMAAFFAVSEKIDDFFARVRAVSFDPRAMPAMNRDETAYTDIGSQTIDAQASSFASFPLAHVSAGATLPLRDGLNPAWADRIRDFAQKVVSPLLGDEEYLTEDDYRALLSKLGPQLEYHKSKPSSPWDGIDMAELTAYLDQGIEAKLLSLLEEDSGATDEAGALELVEKLVRFKRDLLKLANNYVSFREFYGKSALAMFQIGQLYIDQRVLHLVMQVNNAPRHVTLGPLSAIYLLYLDAKNAKGEKKALVAALTNGDIDNLSVGRNAVFYDRSGGDWDATVVRIVEQPISIRQAFWAPYKKFVRFIEEQINKRAAEAEAESNAKVQAEAANVDSITKGDVKKPAPPPKKLDIGVVAALGVAVGGITAALGVLIQAFLGLGIWMPLGIVGLMLVISLPSMAVAWLKLRRRNLGPLLDANGWAINVLPRINVSMGKALTTLAHLPPGAKRDLHDPYADKKRPWWLVVLLVVLTALAALWYLGKLDRYVPEKYRSTTVLGEGAPANVHVRTEEPPAAPATAPAPTP